MSDKLYIGIDVGAKGFIATQYNGLFDFFSIADHDLYEISKFIQNVKSEHENIACVIEDVNAIYGSSASATFSFGFNKGYLIGILSANNIPYVLVPPKTWQKEMWNNSDIVVKYKTVKVKGKDIAKKQTDTKATSINSAKRLFPEIDFRRTIKCKDVDDNKVDATLMCEYARRKNL